MINSYKELNAPELVAQWKRLVNGDVMSGRDAHMLRKAMDENGWTPVQLLLGFYQIRGKNSTIPMFLRYTSTWLVEDQFEAEILLAEKIAGYAPKEFDTYWDLLDPGVESFSLEKAFIEAKSSLQQWAERILSQPASVRKIKA